LKINPKGPRPCASSGEILERLLKLGYLAADDMRDIRNLAAARGIP